MGSGSSKSSVVSSSSGGGRKVGAWKSRVFSSSCFRFPPTLTDKQKEESESDSEVESESGGNHEGCQKHRTASARILALNCSDGEQNREDCVCPQGNNSGASSSSATTAAISQSTDSSGRSLSLAFVQDDMPCRLNRAVTSGSSGVLSFLSSGFPAPNNEGDGNAHVDLDTSSSSNENSENVSEETTASREALVTRFCRQNWVHSDMRHSYRSLRPQEPLEGSVRFSRTLSVGRLRDRVLRRTSFSEGLFAPALLDDRSVGPSGQANARRVLDGARRNTSSSRNIELLLNSSSSVDNNDDHVSETLQLRGARTRDLLEHRSAFFERRRRIRSQVRALQRLGSRFENLSGHDRSCILSGQHRSGRCTCRARNRAGRSDDDTSTRASISRIVMLAEALFEVLDEIHQQSVVLSSRPSFSSIGSDPAPKEVVECLPVKTYTKPPNDQTEGAAQCYICLIDYEEGDCMRILPCNHEFHQTCVDKWLKEIRRICPLCRGDICRLDAASSTRKQS
ncbi:uncharacterized protein [Typha angustifolia]|uniref:uncharacterized protein isoform X2 n=1 Tax=Typha angustifolia TaxID=59011 RepID=UPI003C2BAABE